MRYFPTRHARRHSITWLFCLALLLPMAQLAAQWHGLSHRLVDAGTGTQAEHKLGLLPGHCDLCFSAASLGSGALSSVVLPVQGPAVRHALPLLTRASVWLAAPARAYRSRAPPRPTL